MGKPSKKGEKQRLHRVKEVLDEKGKSQYWLAKETGITPVSINGYYKGTVEPTLTNLFKIAEALEVKAKDLLVD